MNELIYPPSAEASRKTGHLFRVAVVVSGVALALAVIELYEFAQSGAWQVGVVGSVTFLLSFLSAWSAWLSRHNHPILGMWLLIGGILIAVLTAASLMADMALVLSLGFMIGLMLFAPQTLPPRQFWLVMSIGILGGTVTLLLDIYPPFEKLANPELQNLITGAAILMVGLYALLVAREFHNSSLYTKLIIAFLVVALGSLSILVFLYDRATRTALSEAANQSLFAAASQTAVKLDSFINANLSIIGTEAQLTILAEYLTQPANIRARSGEEARIAGILYAFSRKDPVFISSYALLDLQGRNIIDTHLPNVGGDESQRSYFRNALESGLPYVSPVEFEPDGSAYLYFSSSVSNESGKVAGVLRMRYSAAILQQLIIQDNDLAGPQSFAILFDENHVRLAHGLTSYGNASELIFKAVAPLDPTRVAELQAIWRLPRRPPEELATNLPPLAEGLAHASNAAGSRSVNPYFISVLASSSNILQAVAVTRMETQPWLVAFAQPQEVFLAPAQQQTRNTLFLAAIIVPLITAVAVGLAQLLTRPIIHLTNATTQVAAGNLSIRAPVESRDELGKLAATFNLMTAQLAQTLHGLEQEVAERKRTEEALQQQHALLSSIMDTSPVGITVVDPTGQITFANPRAEQVLGLTKDQITRLTYNAPEWRITAYDGSPFSEEALPFYRVINRGETVHDVRHAIEWPDGRRVLLSINAAPLFNESGQVGRMIATVEDVTARIQAEAEREALIAELETKNAELERFTYTVSHDLKSPLITIKGFLGLLERNVLTGKIEQVRKDITRISSAAEKMEQLLQDLLELSRIGRLMNPPEEIPLAELAHEAIAMVAGRLVERGVKVTIASDLPIVYGDRPRLREVLENLVDNAAKYMGDQPHPLVDIGVRGEGQEPVFYVRDNGMGIEPRYQHKVFGLFEKLDQKTEGSGVGLAIVKRIIEVHGGCIWIESEGQGKGSAFCFTLPHKNAAHV